MINVKYPRRGFVVEEVTKGCKTEGCPAKKLIVIPFEDYGEQNFNELTENMTEGQNAYDDYNEGACPICKKAVTFNRHFIVTSDANVIKTAEGAVNYAVHILNKPFPEGEALIATSVENSYIYAKDVLHAPFPLGEAAIAKDAEYSYYYAILVLEAPFPLGEAAIAKDATYFKKYKELFPEPQVVAPEPPKANDYERKIKIEFTFSVHQLKILLEATSYFLDGIEDDEEHEFKANKVDVAELNKTLEKIVKRD
jgi:hypothetical protein